MNAVGLTAMAVAVPLLASLMMLLMWPARLLLEGLLSALPGRLIRFLPTPGRVSRAVGWGGLFGAVLPLVIVPVLPPELAGPDWQLLRLSSGLWLFAVTIAVVGLCGGVAAWMDEAGRGTWILLTALTGLMLAAVAGQVGILVVAALDIAGWLVGFALILTGRSGGDVDAQLLRRATRRYLVLLVLSSAALWVGLVHQPTWPSLLAVGLLIRAAAIGVHTGGWSAYTRLPTPLAMLLAGSMFPTAALLAAQSLGHHRVLAVWAMPAAALFLFASLRELDLRQTTGRWVLAGITTALGLSLAIPANSPRTWSVLLATPHGGFPELACIALAAAAAAAAMATYLAGSVQRAVGHHELSRMGGLAARLPGLFGWSVAGVMLLGGAVPFASLMGRVVLSLDNGVSLHFLAGLSLLSVVSLTTTLSVVHRIFLGTPRIDAEPIELSGRERLVLVLLAATAVVPLAAPLTLLKGV